MKADLQKLKKEFEKRMKEVQSTFDLEKLEQDFFSRKSGKITDALKGLSGLPEDARKETGRLANEIKIELEGMLAQKKEMFSHKQFGALLEKESIDVTQPRLPSRGSGHLHPVTQVQSQLEDLFTSMGFMVLDGPELESEYYNFEAVNIPADHPARESQDTFYIKGRPASSTSPADKSAGKPGWLMRTHTSPVQVRAMEKYGVPLRMVVPGRCFRNEATDARHEHTFYQLEGLIIDKGISISHMKGVLEAVAKYLYGEETEVRLRPKFYPFVEPGVNGEVTCSLCAGKGCSVCKNTGWLEIFGAGMIHPNVLKEGRVDPAVYTGFAFGFGLTRLVMLKYGIEDIRHLQSGDLRFLKQF